MHFLSHRVRISKARYQLNMKIRPSERTAFYISKFMKQGGFMMKYDIQKREAILEMNHSIVRFTFGSDKPETSIWHYVFSALSEQVSPSVQYPEETLK